MALTKISRGLLNTGISDSSDATAITIDSSESVGINYTTPSSMNASANNLVVGSGASGDNTGLTIFSNSDASGSIHFADGTSGAAAYAGHIFYTHSTNHMGFGTDGSERMRIGSNGKIGIATTSTDHQLSVNAADFDGIQLLQGGTDTGYIGVYHDGSSTGRIYVGALSTIDFQTGNGGATDGTSRVRIDANNVFLNGGTDARIQLGTGGAGANQVSNDTVHIRGDGDDMKLMCANDGQFLFEHNGTERMRISASSGSYAALHYTSDYGRVDIGAVNTGYHHIMAQSGPSKFYFNVRCEANGGFHTYSDENLKKDITTITGALDSVAKMKGVTFKWKDAANRGGHDTGKQFGVTAQNMLEVDAELPSLDIDPLYNASNKDGDYFIDGVKKDDKYYTMDYARLTPFFIEAIKELKTKLEAAEAKIETLEGN